MYLVTIANFVYGLKSLNHAVRVTVKFSTLSLIFRYDRLATPNPTNITHVKVNMEVGQ